MTLQDKQVDHLILLVGGNPLPNAVAAKLLVKPGGTISLIYSEGSSAIAECLRTWLDKGYKLFDTQPINEAQSSSIMREISRVLENERATARVGLNYTGGTKAMAVHAFRAAEAWGNSHNTKVDFSYLDARSLHMVFESPNESQYVGGMVKFGLMDFINLHGWELKHTPRQKASMPETAAAIGQVYARYAGDPDHHPYKAWKETVLYTVFKKGGRQWVRNFNQYADAELSWPSGTELESVTQALKAELKQDDFPMLSVRDATKVVDLNTEDFVKWLDGIWLEHRVLSALNHLPEHLLDLCTAPEYKLNGAWHLESAVPKHLLDKCPVRDQRQLYQGVKPKKKDNEFDLDAAAIAGFQLFAFSCGTAVGRQTRGELKLKFFECIIRARQLGGDQARAALVCPFTDPDDLQREVAVQLDPGDQEQSRVKVFGRTSLANLETEISTWIQVQLQ